MSSSLNSVIGSLRANLSLDTAEFQAGAKKAETRMKGLQGNMKASLAAIGKISAGIMAGLAASLGGVIAGSANYASTVKEMANSARILGMSAESYQVLSKAAGIAGIEADKIKDIFKDLNDRIGEYMATGGGELKDFMEQIAAPQGFTAKDLLALPAEERLVTMKNLMDGMNISLEKQTFYFESIADDATLLLPLLENGGAKLNQMRESMLATGQILSNDVIGNLSTFSTNLTGISGVMQGWGNILISGFVPQLESISTQVLTFLQTSSGIRDMFASMGSSIGIILQTVSDNFSRIVSYASAVVIGLGGYGIAMGAAALATGGLSGALVVLRSALMTTGIGAIVVLAGEAINRFWEWASSIGGISNAFQVVSIAAKGTFANIESTLGALGDYFSVVALGIKGGFLSAFGTITNAYGSMVSVIESGLNVLIDGVNSIGGNLARLSGGDAIKGVGQAAIDAANENFSQAGAIASAANEKLANVDWSKPFTDATQAAQTFRDEVKDDLSSLAAIPPAIIPGVRGPDLTTPPGEKGKGSKGKKEKAAKESEYSKAVKQLTLDLERLNATMGMSELQEKIWTQTRDAGVLGQSAQSAVIKNLNEQIDALEKQKEAAQSLKDGMKSTFTSIITGSMKAKDALRSFVGTILSGYLQQGVNSMFANIFGGIGQSTGKGIFGTIFKSIAGAWSAGSASPIGENANGTNNWRGGLTWVGERGKELINLPKGSSVYSHQKSMAMVNGASGGSSSIQISLSPELIGSILSQAENQSVSITRAGISQFDAGLPGRIKQFQTDPRKR